MATPMESVFSSMTATGKLPTESTNAARRNSLNCPESCLKEISQPVVTNGKCLTSDARSNVTTARVPELLPVSQTPR